MNSDLLILRAALETEPSKVSKFTARWMGVGMRLKRSGPKGMVVHAIFDSGRRQPLTGTTRNEALHNVFNVPMAEILGEGK